MELNNREIATLFWLGLAFFLMSFKAPLRSSAFEVLKSMAQPRILQILSAAMLWSGLCILAMKSVGIWHWENLKTTVVWMSTFAFVTLLDIKKLEEPDSFRVMCRHLMNATTVIVFVAEFASFSLPIEILLVPFLVALSGMRAVSTLKESYKPIQKTLEVVAGLVGATFLFYSAWRIVLEFSAFARLGTALEFAVPIVLSLLFFPFIFGLSLVMVYERVFISVRHSLPNPDLHRYARWQALIAFRCDRAGLADWQKRIRRSRPTTHSGVDATIAATKAAQYRERKKLAVDHRDGWAPHLAKDFLKAEGLHTYAYEDYGDGDWSCSGPYLELDDAPMPNRVEYALRGNMHVVKCLRLRLYVNYPAQAATAETRFTNLMVELLHIVGIENIIISMKILNDENSITSFDSSLYAITLTRENWEGGIPGGYEVTLSICIKRWSPDL